MTEAPDVYPDFPADDDADVADGGTAGVEGRAEDVTTGDPRVDEVLASLAGLDGRPVAEHAAVFESAHERLRAALDPDHSSDRESA